MKTSKLAGAVAAMLAMCALAACQSSPHDEHVGHDASASDAEGHDHGQTGEAESEPITVGMGGSVSLMGDDFEVNYTVEAVDTADRDDSGDKPADDQTLVLAHLTVAVFSGSHSPQADNTDFVLTLVDGEGNEYERSERVVSPQLPDSVKSGDSAQGIVVFEVPAELATDCTVTLAATGVNGGDQVITWTPPS